MHHKLAAQAFLDLHCALSHPVISGLIRASFIPCLTQYALSQEQFVYAYRATVNEAMGVGPNPQAFIGGEEF